MKISVQTKQLMVKYLIGEKDPEILSGLAKSIKDDFTERFLNEPMYNFDWIYANTNVYIGRNTNDPHKGSVVISSANVAIEIFFRIKETVVVSNEEALYCVEITTKDALSRDVVDIAFPEAWYKVTPQGIFPVSHKEARDYKKRFKTPMPTVEGIANSKRITTIDTGEIAEKLKGMKRGEILTIVVA